jgi:hypothetical protein
MSYDAGCSGMSTTASRPVAEWVAGARNVLIGFLTFRCGLAAPVDFYLINDVFFTLVFFTLRPQQPTGREDCPPDLAPLASRRQRLPLKSAMVDTSTCLSAGT